jgi:dTDP-4-dehydrorhamnose 3,5-epimerase
MIFTETQLAGAYLVDPERIEDGRGFFARTWCRDEFKRHRLNPGLVQCSVSYNRLRGTLRGMHFQAKPHEEAKLVRCTRGAIYDVIVDLRNDSPTYRHWIAVELTAENRRMLYVPEGFAHGFQTLADETEVFYQISKSYYPQAARGLRYDDPAVGITWPLAVAVISQKDQGYPLCGTSLEAVRS